MSLKLTQLYLVGMLCPLFVEGKLLYIRAAASELWCCCRWLPKRILKGGSQLSESLTVPPLFVSLSYVVNAFIGELPASMQPILLGATLTAFRKRERWHVQMFALPTPFHLTNSDSVCKEELKRWYYKYLSLIHI